MGSTTEERKKVNHQVGTYVSYVHFVKRAKEWKLKHVGYQMKSQISPEREESFFDTDTQTSKRGKFVHIEEKHGR